MTQMQKAALNPRSLPASRGSFKAERASRGSFKAERSCRIVHRSIFAARLDRRFWCGATP